MVAVGFSSLPYPTIGMTDAPAIAVLLRLSIAWSHGLAADVALTLILVNHGKYADLKPTQWSMTCFPYSTLSTTFTLML